MSDFGLPELPGARPGSGEPKICDLGLPELPGARPDSGEGKMCNFCLPELPGAWPGSGVPKCAISVYWSCQESGLAPVNKNA